MFMSFSSSLPRCLSSVCVTRASGAFPLTLPYSGPYQAEIRYVVLCQKTDRKSRALSLPIKPACLHDLYRSQPS